ncbi:hypothetical protein GQ457_08G019240 [Hibiscus cannabinus]
MSFFGIVWTLWIFGNEIVFRGKYMDVDHQFGLPVLRVSWWCKAKCSYFSSISDLSRFPSTLCSVVIKVVRRPSCRWVSPPQV